MPITKPPVNRPAVPTICGASESDSVAPATYEERRRGAWLVADGAGCNPSGPPASAPRLTPQHHAPTPHANTARQSNPHTSPRNLSNTLQNPASCVVAKLMRMSVLGCRSAWNRAPGASR